MVERYNPRIGKKKEVACFYEVFVDGEWVELCRYDSCHNAFHRHRAHWPKGNPVRPRDRQRDMDFPEVPAKNRAAVALDDIKKHAGKWQRLIPVEGAQGREAASAS